MNLLRSLSPFELPPTTVVDAWLGRHQQRRTVVARVNTVNNRDKVITITVASFEELKRRLEHQLDCVGIRLFHCNSDMRAEVTDLDYVRQLEVTSDLLTVLTPGQRFKKTKKSGKAVQKSDNRSLRRHVPPPDGEIARMTIDIFKQNEDDIGSIKITTSLSENSAMSYDIHIPGLCCLY